MKKSPSFEEANIIYNLIRKNTTKVYENIFDIYMKKANTYEQAQEVCTAREEKGFPLNSSTLLSTFNLAKKFENGYKVFIKMLAVQKSSPNKQVCNTLLNMPGGTYSERMKVYDYMKKNKFLPRIASTKGTMKVVNIEQALEFYKYILLQGIRIEEDIFSISLAKEETFKKAFNFICEIQLNIDTYSHNIEIDSKYKPRHKSHDIIAKKIKTNEDAEKLWQNILEHELQSTISQATYNVLIEKSKDWESLQLKFDSMQKFNSPNHETNKLINDFILHRDK